MKEMCESCGEEKFISGACDECHEEAERLTIERVTVPLKEQIASLAAQLAEVTATGEAARERVKALEALLNTPEVDEFDKAVPLEAAHQVERWGSEHDAGKTPEDWFWLVGYLAGKSLAAWKAGDMDRAKHHCISAAGAIRNWHGQIRVFQAKWL